MAKPNYDPNSPLIQASITSDGGNAWLVVDELGDGANSGPSRSRRPSWLMSIFICRASGSAGTSTKLASSKTQSFMMPTTGTQYRSSDVCSHLAFPHTRQGPNAVDPPLTQYNRLRRCEHSERFSPQTEHTTLATTPTERPNRLSASLTGHDVLYSPPS
jgi:hypothetical protein